MKKLLLFLLLTTAYTHLNAQIAPPLNMTLHASWDPDTLPSAGSRQYNDVWGWVDCEANEYAIVGSAGSVHFFDVTERDTIKELAYFPGGEITVWRDMKTYRDRAYAISENTTEGLMIFDLSNIQDTIIKSYHSNDLFNKAHNIYIDEQHGRLYVVGTDFINSGILVLDIETDPDNPIVLGAPSLPGGGYVHDVYVRDNIAYCSHGYEGFYIWDFTDAQNPVYMGDVLTGGYNHSSWVTDDGNYVIYAEEVPIGLPLGVLDISDIQNGNIEEVTTFKFPLLAPMHENNVPHNPFIRGDYAIVSHYHDGLQIFDISDPTAPSQVAYYDTYSNDSYAGYQGNWGVYAFLPSGNLLVSDINAGLLVLSADSIDLAPINPTLYPDNTLTDHASPLCEGSNGALNLPIGAETYAWYQDSLLIDSINIITIDTAGNYYAILSNGHCVSKTDTLSITISPLPDATVFFSGNVLAQDDTSAYICEGEILTLAALLDENFTYEWSKDSTAIATSNVLDISEAGTYQIAITSQDACLSESVAIQVNISEIASNVIIDSTLLRNTIPAAAYQWYLNDVLIDGAINSEYTAVESGLYTCVASNLDGCTATSEPIDFVFVSTHSIDALTGFSLFPNPAHEIIQLNLEVSERLDLDFTLMSIDGRIVQQFGQSVNGQTSIPIDLSTVSAGVYFLKIESKRGIMTQKIIRY